MRVWFLFTVKNILQNKFRAILVLLSISLTTALFFGSLSISETMEENYIQQMRADFGSADIVITPKAGSSVRYINKYISDIFRNDFEYAIGTIRNISYFKSGEDMVPVNLNGYSLNELQSMNPVTLDKQMKLEPFEGKKMIISSNTAEKYNLSVGDSLLLELHNNPCLFVICGIAVPKGLFSERDSNIEAVVPIDTLSAISNLQGFVSSIYVKLRNPEYTDKTIADLSKIFFSYEVKKTIDTENISLYLKKKSNSLLQIVTVVIFLSMFIIYTSFKIITVERLPMIGTLRSLGASKHTACRILLWESLLYGGTGGVIGCAMGIYSLPILGRFIRIPSVTLESVSTIRFNYLHLGVSCLIALLMAVVGSILPIMNISGLSIKDIILNNIRESTKRPLIRELMGGLFFILPFCVLFIPVMKNNVYINIANIIFLEISIILFIPGISGVMIEALRKVITLFFGNEGILAVKNMRGDRNIITNISLIVICISSLFMINSTSEGIMEAVNNTYNHYQFDFMLYGYRVDKDLINSLRMVKGVESAMGVYEASQIKIANLNEQIQLIRGIDSEKYLSYMNISGKEKLDGMMNKLNNGRYIIISEILREMNHLAAGDIISLQMANGIKDYKILGSFDSDEGYGSYGLVSETFLKADMSLSGYQTVYVKAYEEPETVRKMIQNRYFDRNFQINIIEQLRDKDLKINEDNFMIMRSFVLLALIIGFIGLTNNFIVSYLERRRTFALLRSIGMDKRQNVRLILIESVTTGIIGGITGVATGMLISIFIPNILSANGFTVQMQYSPALMAAYLAIGIMISVGSSVFTAGISAKSSIIEHIKYV